MDNLVTLDEYKQFASIEGKKDNAQLQSLITACSQLVQDYLGYTLEDSTGLNAVIRTRKGATEYMLPSFDAVVNKVTYKIRGTTLEKELTEDDVHIEDTGLIQLYDIIPGEGDIIKVAYTANKELTEALKLATNLLVKFYYKEEFNKTSIGAAGQTVTYQVGKNFPPHIRAILMMYRLL